MNRKKKLGIFISHALTTCMYLAILSQYLECVKAVLDSTVDRDNCVNHHEVLEVDYRGNTPDSDHFRTPWRHNIELIMSDEEYFKV